MDVHDLIEYWSVSTHQSIKYSVLCMGVNIDENKEEKKQKKRGKFPDKMALARYGIDYDSI